MSTIRTVGVIGAGTMGNGIAQACAVTGIRVVMVDVSDAALEKGRATIAGSLERLVKKEKLTVAQRDTALAHVHPSTRYHDLAEADLVIEAATENPAIKVEILRKVDEIAKNDAVVASNTSSISITKLAAASGRPERVIGMHFMNPVPIMKLVEIVRGLPTSDATYQTTIELAQRFGKTTVAARDIPGFIVNRVLIPLLNEACYALYEGLGTPGDIDTGVKLGLNHPMGPLELADLIGLDTVLAIANVLHQELGDDKYRPCPLLRQHVAAGWLGKKVGRGFYKYDATGAKS